MRLWEINKVIYSFDCFRKVNVLGFWSFEVVCFDVFYVVGVWIGKLEWVVFLFC